MMRDVIERFRYRFELWHRERREDLFGTPRTDSPHEPDHASRYADPKYAAILSESTPRFVGRIVGVYFGIIIIAAQICRFVSGFSPSARLALAIGFLTFVALWTLGSILGVVGFCKARKARRETAINSSTEAQLTTSRPCNGVSLYESPLTPSIPRFRQR
jgi:hypothetical protein